MCSGGELLADFVVGGIARPTVPARVAAALVPTVDGRWVVWAQKRARAAGPHRYEPLTEFGGTATGEIVDVDFFRYAVRGTSHQPT